MSTSSGVTELAFPLPVALRCPVRPCVRACCLPRVVAALPLPLPRHALRSAGHTGHRSGVGNVAGVWIFKRYLRNAPWRPLFAVTIIVSTGLSLSQLVLIYGLNRDIGIPDLAFAMGDDLIAVIANQFISMPIWVM
jgi:hypothetical protein